MRDHSERALRIACWILGAFLVVQVARVVAGINPLAHLSIPALPALSVAAEASGPGKSTNAIRVPDTLNKGTNASARESSGSNSPAAPLLEKTGSNSFPQVALTDSVARVELAKPSTNSAPGPEPGGRITGPGLPPGPAGVSANRSLPRGMPAKLPDLPPAIMARVDRVTDSEILGPIAHPLPLALLGIAGDTAFLRAPSGQTGIVKEGEDLGPVKLLRIGINRVLVEQDGQKKELMIFSGFGGEPLLPQDHSNETTTNRITEPRSHP
jgi:hypothetical protein